MMVLGLRFAFIYTAESAGQLYEAVLQRLGWLESFDQMLELILERSSRLHRGRQLHELLVNGRSHPLKLTLKDPHRFKPVSQILQMAVNSLDWLERRRNFRQLFLEFPQRLKHVRQLCQLAHRFKHFGESIQGLARRLDRIEYLGYGLIRSKIKD